MMATDDDAAGSRDGAMSAGVPPDGSELTSPSAGSAAAEKPAYPPPANLPTQLDDPSGVRFDFNMGARVLLPQLLTDRWHVRLRDLDTGNILFESTNQGAFVASSKHFYVRFGLDLWRLDGAGTSRLLAVWSGW